MVGLVIAREEGKDEVAGNNKRGRKVGANENIRQAVEPVTVGRTMIQGGTTCALYSGVYNVPV